jgi:hypothetical protein
MILFQVGHKFYQHQGKETARAVLHAAKRLSKNTIIWAEVEPGIFEKQGIRYTEDSERIPGNTYVYLRKRYRMDLAGNGEKKVLEFNGNLGVTK